MARWKYDKLFLSYFAGFVDGEGTVSVQRRSRKNGWVSFDPYLSIPRRREIN